MVMELCLAANSKKGSQAPHENKAIGDWTGSFRISGRVRKTCAVLALDWTGYFGISGRVRWTCAGIVWLIAASSPCLEPLDLPCRPPPQPGTSRHRFIAPAPSTAALARKPHAFAHSQVHELCFSFYDPAAVE